MASISCEGCDRIFSHAGYSHHLSLTTNPACTNVRKTIRSYVPSLEDSTDSEIEESDPAESKRSPSPSSVTAANIFEGDFFGDDYREEDFEWHEPDEPRNESSRESSDDESDDSDLDVENGPEQNWEPPPPPRSPSPLEPPMDEDVGQYPDRERRRGAEEKLKSVHGPVVERFSKGDAGAPISGSEVNAGYKDYSEVVNAHDQNNVWAPFASKIDWEVARWAKLRGPGSTAVSELLGIEGLHEILQLSYKNSKELNNIVDKRLPGRPRFRREEIIVAGEAFDVYFRDIIECIRALFSEPDFAALLVFAPERHYADEDKTVRLYHDMHTGKWWWSTQLALEKERRGATIIPVIISSDKTQLTLFRNKSAYPVYLTIGNLPKEIRRKPSRQGQILLAYLPTTRLEHMKNQSARRRALANLFHACMARILQPLKKAGIEGLPMASGDGVMRRCHPLFATFIGDYPEQLLATCVKNGECPTCPVPHDELGNHIMYAPRDLDPILDALEMVDDSPTAFAKACVDAGIKPVYHPFWEGLPYTNIYQSITPDILHQLYQGIIKHLLSWLKEAFGAAEIDARCRRLPPNHNVRFFSKGITTLSRVSGQEHKDISRILLGLIVDLRLPGNRSPTCLICAVRSLLDFLYLAQYPSHTSETLVYLKDALDEFHANKSIFVDLGIRSHFNLPKLHYAEHYLMYIKLYGTTDNYNTEYTERLHIDFAKDAYRATNRKDEYPQMTLWLERKEKIQKHELFVKWRLAGGPVLPVDKTHPMSIFHSHVTMTKHPSVKAVLFSSLATDYGATRFRDALAHFIVKHRNPNLSSVQSRRRSEGLFLPFNTVPVFHKIKLWNQDPQEREGAPDILDVVHARPARVDKQGRAVPARFDTVLVNLGNGEEIGVDGYRVAQVRAVFRLPPRVCDALFASNVEQPGHLAYVEWFSVFASAPEKYNRMYRVSREVKEGKRVTSVISVANIRRSVFLFPKFGPVTRRDWSTSSVLDECKFFYVDPFLDRHTYITVY